MTEPTDESPTDESVRLVHKLRTYGNEASSPAAGDKTDDRPHDREFIAEMRRKWERGQDGDSREVMRLIEIAEANRPAPEKE